MVTAKMTRHWLLPRVSQQLTKLDLNITKYLIAVKRPSFVYADAFKQCNQISMVYCRRLWRLYYVTSISMDIAPAWGGDRCKITLFRRSTLFTRKTVFQTNRSDICKTFLDEQLIHFIIGCFCCHGDQANNGPWQMQTWQQQLCSWKLHSSTINRLFLVSVVDKFFPLTISSACIFQTENLKKLN